MGFRMPKAMSGARLRPMPARLLGLLALLTILTLAACADEASPAPTHTPTPEAEVVSTAAPTGAHGRAYCYTGAGADARAPKDRYGHRYRGCVRGRPREVAGTVRHPWGR